MKNIFSFFLFGILSILFISCENEIEQTVLKAATPPVLTATPTTIVLTSAAAADTVMAFLWNKTEYGFNAASSYTLQIAKAGTNFAAVNEINLGNGRSHKYTAKDLNQIALLLGLAPNVASGLDVRVKSTLTDSLPVVYSNMVTVTVTPYLVIINYPSLWVPGDYQGWDPATAPKISSKAGNGIYEGYVNITPSSLQFKYTSHPDWNHIIYGWASSTTTGNDVSGTFNTSGGNLFVPTAGYYLLKGNTNNNVWSATKITSLSLIGDFNSWNGDVPMTYNATTKKWTATISPSAAGGFKIRANNDWAINFGDTGADLSLEYNGANISITPGSHVITVDLSTPGNYTYTIQ